MQFNALRTTEDARGHPLAVSMESAEALTAWMEAIASAKVDESVE